MPDVEAPPRPQAGPWPVPADRVPDRPLAVAARSPAGRVGFGLLALVALAAVAGPWVWTADPFVSVGAPLQPPSSLHPLGTDDLGRDMVALVVHGLRTSLVVAMGVVTIAASLAITIGATAGFRPGTVDDLLMRATETVQVVPRFFLAVVVVALFGTSLTNLVVLLGLTSWTWTARVVRAETLSLRERDFVGAARALGAGGPHILRCHIGPNVLPSTLVMLSVAASSAILIEAGLGFVGLSDPDVVSLGSLANNAQRFLRTAWWLALFPGVVLVMVVVGVNLVGDAVGDAYSQRQGPAVLRARSGASTPRRA